jgi:branched-chain amino acid transport system ATP-binding protein
MLELRDVRVAVGRAEVIEGVELVVGKGEVVGMIGPNGAGKSSLLRAICGLLRPSGGEISFDGHPLSGLAPEQIARLGVAMVPESRHVFKSLTVTENLRLAEQKTGDDELDGALQRFPILRERADERADRLSGGEQQQLAIALALIGRPKLLILDEPSLGLAPKTIDVIYELLSELREEGVTMLLAEQNAARTIEFCDRCLVLAGGRVRARGSRKELQASPEVVRAYLGGTP